MTSSGVSFPNYYSGVDIHPNPAGYKVMGESIDLCLFRTAARGGTR